MAFMKINLIDKNTFLMVCLGLGLMAQSYGATQKTKYIYESPLSVGLDIQGYKLNYKNYLWNSTTKLTTEGYGFNLGLEWIPFLSPVGKMALSSGIGFATIVEAPVSSVSTANLYVVPIYLGLTYRADFIKNQVLVPFISAGVDLGFSTQTSKTGDSRSGVSIYKGYFYSSGLELCLNTFDSASGRELDSRMGINGFYLVAMYLSSKPFAAAESVNLSHDEIRVGIRFEI